MLSLPPLSLLPYMIWKSSVCVCVCLSEVELGGLPRIPLPGCAPPKLLHVDVAVCVCPLNAEREGWREGGGRAEEIKSTITNEIPSKKGNILAALHGNTVSEIRIIMYLTPQ